jgi:hypothetical protein
VVDLDRKVVEFESGEDLNNDAQDLSVGNHRVVYARDIEIALVELPHPSLGNGL